MVLTTVLSNPLQSPILGGHFLSVGDTPKTPAGDFSPTSLYVDRRGDSLSNSLGPPDLVHPISGRIPRKGTSFKSLKGLFFRNVIEISGKK